MKNEYIYISENVEEAIKKGLKDLNLKENEVKIEVIDGGSSGLFGFFKKESKVKLIPLDENYDKEKNKQKEQEKTEKITKIEIIEEEKEVKIEQKEEVIKEDLIIKNKEKILEYTTKIIHSMGFKTAVINFEEEGNKNYKLRVTNVENSSLLIGKRGNTLNSIQVLVENYAKKFTKHYYKIIVDCDEYRENRKETLEELAINIAKKSKKLKKPIELEPMISIERKIIHNALKDIKNVETKSVGEEPNRYLVITSK